jgi:hypothetical protein
MGLFSKMKVKLFMGLMAIVCLTGGAYTTVTASANEASVSAEYSQEIGANSTDSATDEHFTDSAENNTENEFESVKGETESKDTITWEDFLDGVQEKADEYGKGDEWAEAINNIKYAVSEKKFDGLFWVNIVELVALAFYIIYKVVSNISLKLVIAKVDTLIKKISELTSSTNELIDEAKCVEKGEKNILTSYENERKALEYTNEALKNMVDGIKFTPEKKAAALRALNKANEYLDESKSEANK